jgi:AP2-like factor (ANT lineage)
VTPKPGGRTRGRQIYLGGYLTELEAAKSYDKAAIKLWGTNANLNFNYETYAEDIEVMKSYDFADYVKALRRESSGFTRGVSKYRGVTKHVKSATNKHGKTFTKQIWEARLGRVKGSKYAYLGTFDSEIEAARGYDLASLKFRGDKAVTNFDKSNYSETEIETYKFPHRAAICDDTNDNDDDGDDNEGTKKIKNKNENKKDKAKWKP